MQPVFVLMILEMLCVNLYVGHICHERKASPVIVVPVMAAFTLLLLGLSAPLPSQPCRGMERALL